VSRLNILPILIIVSGGLSRVSSSSSSLGQAQSSSYTRNAVAIPPSPQRGVPVRGNSSSSFSTNGGSLGGIASGTPRMGRGIPSQRSNSNLTPCGQFLQSSSCWLIICLGTPQNYDGRYMASSSASSSGVVSGGRNVPLSLSFSSTSAGDGIEDGMFVQRTEEELVIEQVGV
jgi:hypothetical protein